MMEAVVILHVPPVLGSLFLRIYSCTGARGIIYSETFTAIDRYSLLLIALRGRKYFLCSVLVNSWGSLILHVNEISKDFVTAHQKEVVSNRVDTPKRDS